MNSDPASTLASLSAPAPGAYDEDDQHERAMSAMRLVRDDIADGRPPDQRLITTAMACACRPCLDGIVDQAIELAPWLPSPVERFVAECCELTPGAPLDVTPAAFYEGFTRWALDNGVNTEGMTKIRLGRELSTRFGIRSMPIHGVRTYRGLAIRRRPAANADRASANAAICNHPVSQALGGLQLGEQIADRPSQTIVAVQRP